jgi:arabinan endo-1,5-alpha-L-arabinosidase
MGHVGPHSSRMGAPRGCILAWAPESRSNHLRLLLELTFGALVRQLLKNHPFHFIEARLTILIALVGTLSTATSVRAQLTGQLGAHDPSTVIKADGRYYYFATGQGIASRSSANKTAWTGDPSVFSTQPAWTTQAIPSFTGHFWAPDVAYFNGKYHLYYSASEWGTIDSAIGLVTTPSLSNPTWTDQGKVVQSDAVWEAGPNTDTTGFNAIDPSILADTNGKVWMAFGSYSSGILVTELDPATGKRLNPSTLSATLVANNAPGGGWGSTVEGAALTKHDGMYYLFVNYGGCCSGVDSTYDIRVGRSVSPTGPFLDKSGVDMRNGGGTIFLDDDGRRIGPGHFSLLSDAGQDSFGYHFYNGDVNGAPTYELRNLYWTSDAWPSYAVVNPNWLGTSSSNWSAVANWSTGGVPNGVGHDANFTGNAFNRYSVAVDGGGKTVSSINFRSAAAYTVGVNGGSALTLDSLAGDAATVNVFDGSHTIAAPVTAADSLGVDVVPAASTLTLSGSVAGSALRKYGAGKLALGGNNAFTSSVFVKRGTLEISGAVIAGQFSSVGHFTADTATMIVRGTGSFTASADLNIGDTGDGSTPATGTLELRDSAAVTVNATGGFYVGSGFSAGTRAVGTVNHTGGTLTASGNFDGAFIVGGRGSALASGTYNLSGGAVTASTNVQIGGRGTGVVSQSGGTFNANSYLAIGRFNGATGSWNISAGTLNQTNAARSLIVGEEGNGTLTVGGNGAVNVAGPLRLASLATAVGAVNLNGGVLTAAQVTKGSGSGTFNFNGGTLRASANQSAFMQGLTLANVDAGGAMIDTQAFNLTVAQPLVQKSALGSTLDGGLTKLGAGTLYLTGASTYSGGTFINAGRVVVSNVTGSGLGTGWVTVAPAGTLGGSGFIGANVVNNGVVNPGVGAGVLTINAGFSQQPGGVLHIDVGGVANFDRLVVNGTAALDGTLKLSLINGFTLTTPTSFDVLDGTTLTGRFVALDLPALSGFLWDASQLYVTGSLAVVPQFEADFNSNGRVDADDLAILRGGYGSTAAGRATGDATGDGVVDGSDFLVWQRQLGGGAAETTATTAVPEPAAAILAAFSLVLVRRRPRI